jgi:tetratricopeptide (TPR) repeat protein
VPATDGRYEAGVNKPVSRSSSPPKAPKAAPDPMAALTFKGLGLRVGLPLIGFWIIAIIIGKPWALAVMGVLTVAAGALVLWAIRFASKARAVADIVKNADSPQARKEALSRLETDFKKGDTAAIFAKAQLQLHEDPRVALQTLEQVDLAKVMAPMADEARAQRAMIHLMLGEAERARQLVDAIDLSRHQQAKTRATLVTVIGEAWARTGQGKKALDTLSVFDPEDPEYGDLKAQLYRAFAFAYAAVNDTKGIRKALRKMLEINPQLLGGFLVKKVHPLLEREAKEMLKRSGAVPKKMVVKRM